MRTEDFEKAAHFRDQITKLKELQNHQVSDEETPVITDKDIEAIVEQKKQIFLLEI